MSTLILVVLFASTARQYQLPIGLLQSVCYVETKHDVNAIHRNDGRTHSYGICQIKLETARYMGFKGSAKDLMLPTNNIRFAAAYLQHQILRYHSVNRGVIAYNIGRAGGLTTTSYQRRVFSVWRNAYPKRELCSLSTSNSSIPMTIRKSNTSY